MDTQLSFIALSGLTVGLVQLVKTLGLPSKFSPLIAVVFGVGLALLASLETHVGPVSSIFSGLIIGLTSVGLYSAGKTALAKADDAV